MNEGLQQSLSAEARASATPAFSADLHARTLARLQAAHRNGVAPASDVLPRRRKPVGTIAVALAVIVLGVWITSRPPAESAPQFVPLMASFAETAKPFAAVTLEPARAANEQFALLRGDAKRFGSFVVDQLPTPPGKLN